MNQVQQSSIYPRLTRILLLEDDPVDQILISRQLSKWMDPIEITTVSRRIDFVRSLLDFVPDLIISDFYLGPFDGLEALILVKNTFPRVPFIILTDEKNPEKIKSWYEQGISACLSKDKLEQLPEVIREAQLRNEKYASQLKKLRILHELRTQIQQITEMEELARKIQGNRSHENLDESIRDFCEASLALEDMYAALRKEAPIH